MAYVDFSPESFATRHVAPAVAADIAALFRPVEAPPVEDAAGFTALELRVIEFAERADATREGSSASPISRFIAWAFGLRAGQPLANPRLERLRHFASLAYHHPDRLRPADLTALIEAGFSRSQARGLFTHLLHRRARA